MPQATAVWCPLLRWRGAPLIKLGCAGAAATSPKCHKLKGHLAVPARRSEHPDIAPYSVIRKKVSPLKCGATDVLLCCDTIFDGTTSTARDKNTSSDVKNRRAVAPMAAYAAAMWRSRL